MGGFNIREIMDSARTFRSHRSPTSRKNSGHLMVNQLPPELLVKIFSYLSAKDLGSVSKVCKVFNEASRVEKIWQNRCMKDYKVRDFPPSPFSYMQLYTKVLHKYGSLLGLWQLDITHYGGLVQVKCEHGKIIGVEWITPKNPDYLKPLRQQQMFSIELSEDGETRVLCLRGYHGPHKCQINMRNGNFSSKCCVPDKHRHPKGKDEEFFDWVKEETGEILELHDGMIHELLLTKFLNVKQYENSYNFRRLQLPRPRTKAIIQPGLFKGTYGNHGLELVLLKYDSDGYTVTATKLLGDPYVPADKITFRANLRNSMILTEIQQLSMEDLRRITRTGSAILPENLPVQPFRVPFDCMDRGSLTPSKCKARFHGHGQVAGHGFTNSSYIPGHWIVFNEDLFGFLWLELKSLSLFHRVQETLC